MGHSDLLAGENLPARASHMEKIFMWQYLI